jgi:predicted enzyme related to lactoylglutathione lyase
MTHWLHVILDLPRDQAADATAFWTAALGWPLGRLWPQHPEFASFAAASGDPYLHRQLVAGGPGVHIDLEVDDLDESADRLAAHGAVPVRRTTDWLTMTSPGGLPFCLIRRRDHPSRPTATGSAERQRRLMQVCIDSPAALSDREVGFWRVATGWRWSPSASAEFAGKLYPEPGSPVQLLLQQLGDDDEATTVRAHLDLGCDDREAEADRLVSLGATRLWTGDGWITLRDPAGLVFCATGNSPEDP